MMEVLPKEVEHDQSPRRILTQLFGAYIDAKASKTGLNDYNMCQFYKRSTLPPQLVRSFQDPTHPMVAV